MQRCPRTIALGHVPPSRPGTDRLQALREELLAAHPGIKVSVRSLDVNDQQQVFDAFHALREDLDGPDRIIVNAGLGKGKPIGTGRFDANLQTARTNFTAALVQCEAIMETFRAQGSGHLVVVSSMSALRGLPRNLTTYAASKAGLSALAEGIRAEMTVTPHPSPSPPSSLATSPPTRARFTPWTPSTSKASAPG
ncbi:SDR family NAD(P)-dependent oxidoreductase [Streptomyces sp. NPDC004266]|uniref:SDR family NAD(P)-dependent oxidoreductase n=1 Tax=Streptomyces sp. NPDC004266 TaxID=3364693 RepID=UPI00367EC220